MKRLGKKHKAKKVRQGRRRNTQVAECFKYSRSAL